VTATTSTLGPRAAVLTDNRPASILFEVGHTRSFLRTREFQEADEHAAEGWGSRSQQVETAIAIMAVSLFLLGLSHTVPVARARAVFTITGVAIAVLAGAWGLSAAVRSVDGPSPRAIDAYLDADGEIHVALDSAGVPLAPLLRGAISKLNTAISLRPGYANALFDRALAAADLAFALKPVRGSAQAVSDLRAAMRYGGDSSLYESNLANDAFWLGRYSEAVAAANRAVSLNPGSLTAVQNQAQYLNLVPGVRRSDVVRSVALLRRDFIDTPHLLADPVYRGLQEELTLVEQYMPALADRARQWQLQLTREIGPLDRP
jgi:tetratricopeptide (TPR) repeat protein